MAIIPQQRLFGWDEIEPLSDLERLQLVLEHMPDEELMQELELGRGRGRNDYPVRGIWNSLLAAVVYQHPSVESLRRELSRNGQLRQMCGLRGSVPTSSAYSRFMNRLKGRGGQLDAMFDQLVSAASKLLPDFGRQVAIDGKAIRTHGRPRGKEKLRSLTPDRRRELDADFGVKGQFRWFGYKLHLVVDATYELPVAYGLTRASGSEQRQAHVLIDELTERHPDLLKRCDVWLGDRGYDDTSLLTRLWDDLSIRPVIDIRNTWKDSDCTRLVTGTDNVVYDWHGRVCCYCPKTLLQHEMAYGGFERDRQTLKYRCPAEHYGLNCSGRQHCRVRTGVRIRLSENRRIFTPLARSSYSWARLYRERTAVERVNSRLDVSFGFEDHFIRGYAKMKVRCVLALSVMLAMAVGRVRRKQHRLMRSLIRAA